LRARHFAPASKNSLKRKLKHWLERNLSNFAPYQMAMGGYRYYKATQESLYDPSEFLHYGKNVRIEAGVAISAPERLYIGDNVGISQKVYINAVGGCHIGNGCQIGGETNILTVEHQYTGGVSLPYDPVRLVKPVYIEDYVWFGLRTSIAPGVRIGEGAIIGMGSVVVQDVPPLAIVLGNPAQILTYRSKPDFDRLKEKGAAIDPYKELPLLKVPPLTKRKYRNEIAALGFDLSKGHEYFRYDKFRARGQRLVPVENPQSQ
jgi:acetyltransferase-like isoleucine patch superfamily enzyme